MSTDRPPNNPSRLATVTTTTAARLRAVKKRAKPNAGMMQTIPAPMMISSVGWTQPDPDPIAITKAASNKAPMVAASAAVRLRFSDNPRRANDNTGSVTEYPITASDIPPAKMARNAFTTPVRGLPNDCNQPR